MAARWRCFAILARYGHQNIPSILGRPLQPLEVDLLTRAIQECLDNEYDSSALKAPGDQ